MNQNEFKNLKVGDKVRIIAKKPAYLPCWNSQMDKWLGKVMTIKNVYSDRITMEEDKNEYLGGGWNWYADHIAGKVGNKQEIHITVDGNKTIAILKENGKLVKRAEAKCNAEDTFDFETGAEIAFNRLFEKEPAPKKLQFKVGDKVKVKTHFCFTGEIGEVVSVDTDDADLPYEVKDADGDNWWLSADDVFPVEKVKEVTRYAKVGEYIKIVDARSTKDLYQNGDIFKVKRFMGNGVRAAFDGIGNTGKNGHNFIYHNEYVVLENYNPPKEEKASAAIKVGDRVEIINKGKSYTTHSDWIDKHAPKYASRYAFETTPNNGTIGEVVAIAEHGSIDDMLYAIDTGKYWAVYLVGEKGIKKR